MLFAQASRQGPMRVATEIISGKYMVRLTRFWKEVYLKKRIKRACSAQNYCPHLVLKSKQTECGIYLGGGTTALG